MGGGRLLKVNELGSYLQGRDYCPEHFVSFKRSSYRLTKGLNFRNRIGDDQELYLLLEEVGKWVVVDKYLYKYRVHSESISRKKTLECYYWNIIIRHEACMRRGLNPQEYSYQDYLDVMNEMYQQGVEEGKDYVRKTPTYRLGKNIMKPVMWLLNLIKR